MTFIRIASAGPTLCVQQAFVPQRLYPNRVVKYHNNIVSCFNNRFFEII